jgi:hypothetical protein
MSFLLQMTSVRMGLDPCLRAYILDDVVRV